MSPINDRITKINERIEELDATSNTKASATALNSDLLEQSDSPEGKKLKDVDIKSTFEAFGV